MEDFAVEMRLGVMNNMPLLASRMRSALLGSPPEEANANSKPDEEMLQLDRNWTADGAHERLGAAYDKGGLGAWAEAAAREVEQEARLELEKRQQLKMVGSRKPN